MFLPDPIAIVAFFDNAIKPFGPVGYTSLALARAVPYVENDYKRFPNRISAGGNSLVPVTIGPPHTDEYDPNFHRYISLVTEGDIMAVLAGQTKDLRDRFGVVPRPSEGYAYGAGKWTIRQMLGHVIDGERVFAYRALCIARGETTPLPGFEEVDYAEHSTLDATPLAELLDEFSLVREANVLMFRHLPPVAWTRIGTANAIRISVRALAWIMAGHVRHHMNILRDRYLPGLPHR